MKKTPSLCETCQNARNCINGRYCLALRRYVHHVTAQTCDSFKQETEQIQDNTNSPIETMAMKLHKKFKIPINQAIIYILLYAYICHLLV